MHRLVSEAPPEERAEARTTFRVGSPWFGCVAVGEGRAVLALWLAGQATPATAALLEAEGARPVVVTYVDDETGETITSIDPYLRIGGGVSYTATGDVVSWTIPEADVATRLLDLPESRVARAFRDHWGSLVSPATSTADAAALFGIPSSTLEQMGEREGLDRPTARRLAAEALRGSVPCR